MGGIETLLPTLGTGSVGVLLIAVILYLLKNNASDRKQYLESVATWEKQFDDAVDRYRKVQVILDQERDQRRKAEDELARATIAIDRMTYEIAALRAEVKLLRAQIKEMNGS